MSLEQYELNLKKGFVTKEIVKHCCYCQVCKGKIYKGMTRIRCSGKRNFHIECFIKWATEFAPGYRGHKKLLLEKYKKEIIQEKNKRVLMKL